MDILNKIAFFLDEAITTKKKTPVFFRNDLVKYLTSIGIKTTLPRKLDGDGGPYQRLNVYIAGKYPKEKFTELLNRYKRDGWDIIENTENHQPKATKDKITIIFNIHEYSKKEIKTYTFPDTITIIGPKKPKDSKLPYYD